MHELGGVLEAVQWLGADAPPGRLRKGRGAADVLLHTHRPFATFLRGVEPRSGFALWRSFEGRAVSVCLLVRLREVRVRYDAEDWQVPKGRWTAPCKP